MIDLVLNNLGEYRARPLYVDLDQCLRWKGTSPFLDALDPASGHVVKTHLPTGPAAGAEDHPRFIEIVEDAVVVTVHRDRDDILASMKRWGRTTVELEEISQEYDDFWRFWEPRQTIAVEFLDLFEISAVGPLLEQIGNLTHTRSRPKVLMPPVSSGLQRQKVYANKILTRTLGRRAPRIDTTIHTLK